VDLRAEYAAALAPNGRGRDAAEWPECPGVDAKWYWDALASGEVENAKLPGLSSRKVDMASFNEVRPPLERRQLHFYRVEGSMPPFEEEPNLHAVAHCYASDRNGLYTIGCMMGDEGEGWEKMGSLSHKVVLHDPLEALSLVDGEGRPRWFCQEYWCGRFAGERADHESRLWTWDGSVARESVVGTTLQDGLVRLREDSPAMKRSGKL